MRVLLVLGLVAGCNSAPSTPVSAPPPPPPSPAGPTPWTDAWILAQGPAFIDDVPTRRAALERSLVNPTNIYSRQRLASYGFGDRGWDALPAWNPRSVAVDAARAAQLASGHQVALPATTPRLWDGTRPTTMAAWVALGERVFKTFPLRAEVYMEYALTDRALADAVGVERTAAGDVPGLVQFIDVDGDTRVGITCAVCHSTVRDGVLLVGAARRGFDYGRLRLTYHRQIGPALDPHLAERMARWGPGRADVTEDDDEDPVAIPDLWGLRDESTLTQAGTIRHDSPMALAIRQETQLLHANHQRIRPPRDLAWALAMYLYALVPPPAQVAVDIAQAAHGQQLFARACSSCHANGAFGGEAIEAGRVGTDPSLANGHARGTGRYRIAPLLRVIDAAPYLHHGAVATLAELLSPARLAPTYTGGRLGPGAIPGHRFGTELSDHDRAALIAYLATL